MEQLSSNIRVRERQAIQQIISSNDYKSLDKLGKAKWRVFCMSMNWGGYYQEDEFTELLQPSIGELMQYLILNKIYFEVNNDMQNPVGYLWGLAKRELER